MTAAQGFSTFLALTVLVLVAVVLTGLKHKRKAHFVLVACAFVLLGVTIYYAERLGEDFDLKSAGAITPIHLFLAKVTVLAYLLPLITGFMTVRNASRRSLHGKVAIFVLTMTGLTFVTGLMMIMSATPL